MTRGATLLTRMRDDPQAGWTIGDVEKVCRSHGIACDAIPGGTHRALRHPRVSGLLTIPGRRPIKPFYIHLLITIVDKAA